MSDQQDQRLTARQQQIVALLVQGVTNKEIARVLNITEGTVKVHLHDIFQRLDVATKLVAKYGRPRGKILDAGCRSQNCAA